MKNPNGKSNNIRKNDRGITLVALIITIIILIILAAVAINSLTHDGLADLAVRSTQEYDKAQTNEMEKLNEIDTMVKETLKNIEQGTVKPKPDDPDISEAFYPEVDGRLAGKKVNYSPKVGQAYNTEDGNWIESKNDNENFPEYSGYKFQYFETNDIPAGWSIWEQQTIIYI